MRTAEASTWPEAAALVLPAASAATARTGVASASAESSRTTQLPSLPLATAVPSVAPEPLSSRTVLPGSACPDTRRSPTTSSVGAAGAAVSSTNSRVAFGDTLPPAVVIDTSTR